LTDTFTDPRGVRRPTSVAELSAICDAPVADIIRIVELFRRPGRSFLMPPVVVPLAPSVVVDLSHESLLRCWTRLIEWAQAERTWRDLSPPGPEAAWFEEGAAGLWDDRAEIGLRWRDANRPTAAGPTVPGLVRPGDRLPRPQRAGADPATRRTACRTPPSLVVAWATAAVLLVMTGVLFVLFMAAQLSGTARKPTLGIAAEAVDKLLVSIDRDPATIRPTCPPCSSSGASSSSARSLLRPVPAAESE
jgi:hypothetical protein